MVRKLHFITVVLISALLVPLPLYARSGSGFGSGGLTPGSGLGRGVSQRTPQGTSQGSLSSFFNASSNTTSSFELTPAAESHGILQITLKTQNAEVYIDDRFIGLASDFNGTVIVSVPSGKHVVEFRYNGTKLPSAHLNIVQGSIISIER
jgi:hypothetical protein